MVNVAGADVRCRKVPEEARVALTEQLPAAMGVIEPVVLLIEHFAGVDVENEYAPSPDPPDALALAL